MKLVTNRIEYANDMAEVVRLFLGNALVPAAQYDAESGCADGDLVVLLDVDGGAFHARARLAGHCEQYRLPVTEATPLAVKRDGKRAMKIAVFRLMRQLYDAATPWGSLTGIRPTKLFRESEARLGRAGAIDLFLHTFDVSAPKTALAEAICAVQAPILRSASPRDVDIYIGVPYCRSRCLYCSFGSLAAPDAATLERYLDTLLADVAGGAALLRERGLSVRSVYVGGGTPTVLSAAQLDRLLTFARDAYGGFGRECTVEAGRPDTIDAEKLSVLYAHGVSRISVNPQTMHDETLRRVGRRHTADETRGAFRLAREIGFPVINMDLIVGLPGETEGDVMRTLSAVSALNPDNLTVHTLALKRASGLKAHADEYPLPGADAVERMVSLGRDAAKALGMRPYYLYRQKYMQGNLENVGYAKPGMECIYNIDMMEECVSILAHGAGAISKRVYGRENRIERLPNPKDVETYRRKLPALQQRKFSLFSD